MFGEDLLRLWRKQELNESFGYFAGAMLVCIRVYNGNRVVDLDGGGRENQLVRLPSLLTDEHLILISDCYVAHAFLEIDD